MPALQWLALLAPALVDLVLGLVGRGRRRRSPASAPAAIAQVEAPAEEPAATPDRVPMPRHTGELVAAGVTVDQLQPAEDSADPTTDPPDDRDTLDELLAPEPGWLALDGVDVTLRAHAWLDLLGARVEEDLRPVVCTSGRRDPWRQAAALAYDLRQGQSHADLHRLYARDDLLAEVLAASGAPTAPDVAAMAEVLSGQVARGQYLSPHLRDDAVDLRTRDRTAEQVERLRAHCRALGADTVLERDHLHVQHLHA